MFALANRIANVRGTQNPPEVGQEGVDVTTLNNVEWRHKMLGHKQAYRAAKDAQLMPDLLREFLPSVNLLVKYGDKLLRPGGTIAPEAAAARPLLAWPTDGLAPPHTPERLWTLLMLGADYPFRDAPLERAVRHWHIANIADSGDVGAGHVVAEYLAPVPTKPSGAHRFMFLLLEQKAPLTLPPTPIASSEWAARLRFDVRDHIKKHHLKPRGAIAFFSAWDRTVNARRSALGL